MANSSLPPGNLSANDIDDAMSERTCDELCVTLVNFFDTDPDAPYPTGREVICFKSRQIRNSSNGEFTNKSTASWDSVYNDWVWDDEQKRDLSGWFTFFQKYSIGTTLDYFEVSPETRNLCFPSSPPVSSPSPTYLGTASPPPLLSEKKMQCCDCNTIATIVENQSIVQLRAQEKLVEGLKDHIDKRALEIIIKDLEHLQALDFEDFLKIILNRLNETESNLWNGINLQK